MSLGVYNGAGAGTTKLLLHMEGNANDSSGNSNNGTSTNITYSQANGKFGQGAGFNGSSSKIEFANTASLRPTNPTVISWIKKSSASGEFIIFQNYQNVGGNNGYILQIINNKALFGIYGTNKTITGNTSVDDGKWHMICGVFDGTNMNLYVDGNIDATAVSGAALSYAATTYPVLGALRYNNNSYTYYFNGAIDEVIIENRAWTASEVRKYYTNARGRFGII